MHKYLQPLMGEDRIYNFTPVDKPSSTLGRNSINMVVQSAAAPTLSNKKAAAMQTPCE